MLISVFSPKGGVGTTVTSVLLGRALCEFGSTLIIDACGGDIESVVGADESAQYCFDDWVCSPEPTSASLVQIGVPVVENLAFIAGVVSENKVACLEQLLRREVPYQKRQVIIDALVQCESHCVLDLGTQLSALNHDIALASDLVVMVLRECYLSMSRAIHHPLTHHVDACVVVKESGRSITSDTIAETLSLSTIIQLDARRDYARCIDAGVLVHRTPPRLLSPVSRYLSDVMNETNVQEAHDVFDDAQQRNNQQFWADSEPRAQRLVVNPSYKKHVSALLEGK